MPVSQRVASRILGELKRYRNVLAGARQRDISESDTVVIIADFLSDALGYNKYQHITTEFSIRGTFVDLAVRVDSDIRFLIEAKAINSELRDSHVKQAIDYGANHGIEWVVLTNGAVWRVYKIHFEKPINKSLVCEVDMLAESRQTDDLVECFGNLSREGFSKGSMAELLQQKQITSKFAVASILISDAMLNQLRRDVRRLSGINVDPDVLYATLVNEVIKRELVDGDEAKDAQNLVRKLQRSHARRRAANNSEAAPDVDPEAPRDPVSAVHHSP